MTHIHTLSRDHLKAFVKPQTRKDTSEQGDKPGGSSVGFLSLGKEVSKSRPMLMRPSGSRITACTGLLFPTVILLSYPQVLSSHVCHRYMIRASSFISTSTATTLDQATMIHCVEVHGIILSDLLISSFTFTQIHFLSRL